LRHGLTAWRRQAVAGLAFPRPWLANIWCKRSLPVDERLQSIETALRSQGAVALRGGDFDCWDLELRGGLLGSARIFAAGEYHGDGRQLLRIRSWPRCSIGGAVLAIVFAALAFGAGYDGAWTACAALGGMASLLVLRAARECAAATAAFLSAVRKIEREEKCDGPV
jgi:hypothetical protein